MKVIDLPGPYSYHVRTKLPPAWKRMLLLDSGMFSPMILIVSNQKRIGVPFIRDDLG